MAKNMDTEGMSLSKQRKIERKKEIERSKKNAVVTRVVTIVVLVLVVGLVGWGIGASIYKSAHSVSADSDFSAQLNDNGTIKNVTAADYVELCDYQNITIDMADVEYSDEDVEADILDLLADYEDVDTESTDMVVDGDVVSIDFVGTVDGVEFDGGTSEDYELEIGSGSFIDDFEEQIIGHVAGDVFDVEVTFPDDYTNDESLAGCDAVFTVTLNGIFKTPEFTDEFVAEYLSDYATTADGYREYLKESMYESNLKSYVEDYLVENSTITEYPAKYLKQLKANYKYNDYYYYQYLNSMYETYYGYTVYSDFEDYLSEGYGLTEEEYDASLGDYVSSSADLYLCCQAIAEIEGLSASYDEALELYLEEGGTEDDFETQIETYGTGYVVQALLCEKVINAVCNMATVQ